MRSLEKSINDDTTDSFIRSAHSIGIPSALYAVLFVFFSAYAMREGQEGTGSRIAHDAHLGGAVGGLVLTILLYPSSVRIFLGQLGIL